MSSSVRGKLTLVPTPISRNYQLSPTNFEILKRAADQNDLILVEDLKPSRQRWTSWGLEREAIDKFVCYNEQTWSQAIEQAYQEIVRGRQAVMFSDGGLPVIADPGRELVFRLRQKGVAVECGQFDNSFLMALALSGFHNDQFIYQGFPPREKSERRLFWQSVAKTKQTQIIMDTAYRLQRVQDELVEYLGTKENEIYLGCDLNSEHCQEFWGKVRDLSGQKIEGKINFVLCVNSL